MIFLTFFSLENKHPHKSPHPVTSFFENLLVASGSVLKRLLSGGVKMLVLELFVVLLLLLLGMVVGLSQGDPSLPRAATAAAAAPDQGRRRGGRHGTDG